MKNLNITRFGRVLKLDFVEGYKPMLWGALCMMLLYLFFFWFAHNIGIHDSRFDYIHDPDALKMMRVNTICEAVSVFCSIAMFIYFLIAASTLYRGEQKKQQRIAWLMLPASNLEKFTSRWIYLLVFSLVGGLLSFFVADLIHMIYLWMIDYPMVAATDDFLGILRIYSWKNALETCSIYICIHSFFLLGGVFFKKFHFIATTAVMVLGLSIVFSVTNAFHLYVFLNPIDVFIYIGLIVLFTWLAYFLFCRWQVITHKFANV